MTSFGEALLKRLDRLDKVFDWAEEKPAFIIDRQLDADEPG